ncbi:MAG: FGGY family carbohydrate kinase [bacterium]|nr:FGGY family carbohydrate kinase [bacterium]
MHYLGLDIGTTTITAVVVDVETGGVVSIRSASNDAEITGTADKRIGRSEWHSERMIQIAFGVIRQAALDSGRVEGVGVTGQMHGMMLVAENGAPEGPFIGWQDRRGAETFEKHDSCVGHMRKISEAVGAFGRGCRPHPGYMGTTLFWLARQGGLSRNLTPAFMPDYAVARLTEKRPMTDATNAAGSGLFDVVDRIWRADLMVELGLFPEQMPELRDSATCAGVVTPAAATRSGLKAGIPVCVACGDNQASFLGSVGDLEGSVLVNVGTGGQVSVHVKEAVSVEELEARPFVDGGFLLVGAGLVGGRSYAWLRDFIREIGKAFYGGKGDEDLYGVMNRLAAGISPGSDGLICEPLFTGTRREPDRRGVWRGVGTSNFSAGHMARALLEGLTDQFHRLYGEMDRLGVGARGKLIGAGNGIRKNDLLRAILEERFGLTMRVPGHTEEAAFGAALMGAIAGGVFEDVKSVGEKIKYVEET